jgi:hypothetical protein
MRKRRGLRVYTVVEVWRGIADRARSFADLGQARRYMRQARRRRGLPENDVELFEDTIRLTGARKRPHGRC